MRAARPKRLITDSTPTARYLVDTVRENSLLSTRMRFRLLRELRASARTPNYNRIGQTRTDHDTVS
jgi:hypothetical protein